MKKKINVILIILSIITIIFIIYSIFQKNNKTIIAKENNIITKYQKQYTNKDIVGLLKIENSNILTLITQTTNNNYYLNHSLNKKENKLGTPFIDYRINLNNDKKIIIYGHNSKKENPPFKLLINYLNEDYYKTHKYIKLTINNKVNIYKIFSVYKTNNDYTHMNIYFETDKEYMYHIKHLQDKSIYKINEYLYLNDIIILQTCSRDKDDNYLIICGIKIGGSNEKNNNI